MTSLRAVVRIVLPPKRELGSFPIKIVDQRVLSHWSALPDNLPTETDAEVTFEGEETRSIKMLIIRDTTSTPAIMLKVSVQPLPPAAMPFGAYWAIRGSRGNYLILEFATLKSRARS